MAKVKFYKASSADLSSLPKVNGQIILTTDTGKLYIDNSSSERFEISGSLYTEGTGIEITENDVINNKAYDYRSINGEGTTIVFDNTLKAPMDIKVIKGNLNQDEGTPSPSSPISIDTVTGLQQVTMQGKNLFDVSLFNGLQQNEDGTCTTTKYVSNDGNTPVTFIGDPNTQYTLSFRDLDWNLDGDSFSHTVNGTWKRITNGQSTFTTDANGEVVLRIGASAVATIGTKNRYIQLEKGSSATSYSAYTKNTYNINLGNIELCKIGTYQDTIYKNNNKWYLHKEIGKIVLNGTEETWSITNSGKDTYLYKLRYLSDRLDTNNTNYLCNFYPIVNISSTNTVEGITITSSNELRIRYGTEDTLKNFKAYLASNNPIVYYILATATTTEITDTTLVNQLETLSKAKLDNGSNSIEIDGNLPCILSVSAYTRTIDGLNEIVDKKADIENTINNITSGTVNGTIAITKNGTTSNVSVAGLGSMAYRNSLGASDITSGTMPVARGGLGVNSLSQGEVLIGNGTNAVTSLAIDTEETSGSSNLITSGAVYTGLSTKVNSDLLGVSSGIATLDSNGKIPTAQLPSSINNIEIYNGIVNFPQTGTNGVIYIDSLTNYIYRWDGSSYVALQTGGSSSWYISEYTDENNHTGLGFFMV